MDRGQLFIGVKFDTLKSEDELNTELAKYGYRKTHYLAKTQGHHLTKDWGTERLDGRETRYEVRFNNDCGIGFPGQGVVFGIEAAAAYVHFSEKDEFGRIPQSISRGYSRDWIQEVSLEKLAQLLAEVKKDIPDARVLLMDLHY